MTSSSLKDLQTRGFVVIPSFLSESEVQQCREDFERQRLEEANRNYGISYASPQANTMLLDRIREMSRQVVEQTDMRPDAPEGGAYFATGRGINFSWHQDHESFFAYQNHYDYLNFYIPIVKPVREKTNLSIIPFDVLEKECPATFHRVVKSGASRFIRVGRKRIVFCDDTGAVHVMRRDIERMAHTPMLGPGDLLLLRGDIIHRTQDTDTDRVALSFRVSSSKALVRRSRLADGGLHKARMMAKNSATYERMFRAFDAAKKDEMPITELAIVMKTIPAAQPKAPQEFMRYLLAEKRRAGVLTRFLPKVVLGTIATQYVNLYERLQARA